MHPLEEDGPRRYGGDLESGAVGRDAGGADETHRKAGPRRRASRARAEGDDPHGPHQCAPRAPAQTLRPAASGGGGAGDVAAAETSSPAHLRYVLRSGHELPSGAFNCSSREGRGTNGSHHLERAPLAPPRRSVHSDALSPERPLQHEPEARLPIAPASARIGLIPPARCAVSALRRSA